MYSPLAVHRFNNADSTAFTHVDVTAKTGGLIRSSSIDESRPAVRINRVVDKFCSAVFDQDSAAVRITCFRHYQLRQAVNAKMTRC